MSGQRITVVAVRYLVPRFRAAAEAAGVPGAQSLDVEPGSRTMGVSWKLIRHGDRGARTNGLGWGGNYLGMTAAEAHTAMTNMIAAWEMVTSSP